MKTLINLHRSIVGVINTGVMLAALIVIFAATDEAIAESHKDRIKACSVIPVEVPSFKCEDGYEIAKVVDSKGQCKDPENLYGRCVFQSTLGQLKPKNTDGVQIFYSCRKDPHSPNHKKDYKNDKSGNYFDIAVIQHHPKTGDTCFYQRLGNYPENKTIPAPKDDDGTFWNIKPNMCTACHTNGPFIRTPHYSQVIDSANPVIAKLPSGAKANDYLKVRKGYIKLLKNKPSDSMEFHGKYVKALTILPDAYNRDPKKYLYNVLHENPAVWEIYRKDNLCVECHSIGAHQVSRDIDQAMTPSILNHLATGQVMSLVEGIGASKCYSSLKSGKCPSPTKNGYHPFMEGMYGASLADVKKAINELNECTKEKSKRPKDCEIRNPAQMSAEQLMKWGSDLLNDLWNTF